MSAPDVAIVGGGAVGVSVAYELARAGAAVTLYERGATVAAGCSWGSAGLVAPSHATPLAAPQTVLEGLRETVKPAGAVAIRPSLATLPWLARFVGAAFRPGGVRAGTETMSRLCHEGLRLHREWAGRGLATGFRETGVLYVQRTDARAAAAAERAARHAAAGLQVEVRDAAATVEREPAIAAAAGSVLYAGDALCDPPAFVEAVAAAAREHGAVVETGAEVRAIAESRGRVALEVGGETRRAGAVVVAAGVGSASLLAAIGAGVPLVGGCGYAVELAPAEHDPQVPVYVEEDRLLAVPLPGRLRIAGILVLDGRRPSARRVRAMIRSLGRSLHGISSARELRTWSGLRPLSPDGLPIVGRAAGTASVVVATGHGMMGLTLAPVTGVLVREAIVEGRQEDDLSPERFRRGLRLAR